MQRNTSQISVPTTPQHTESILNNYTMRVHNIIDNISNIFLNTMSRLIWDILWLDNIVRVIHFMKAVSQIKKKSKVSWVLKIHTEYPYVFAKIHASLRLRKTQGPRTLLACRGSIAVSPSQLNGGIAGLGGYSIKCPEQETVEILCLHPLFTEMRLLSVLHV